jgi:hypothetical protein
MLFSRSRFTTLVFCLLLGSFDSISQIRDNYVKGTVILDGGEKKTGLIQNESYSRLKQLIHFKTDEHSNVIAYDPKDIDGIELASGEAYENIDFVPNKEKITVLAKVLIRGRISLWGVEESGVQYYIITRPDTHGQQYVLQDDQIGNGVVVDANERRVIEHHYFRSFLRLATKDAPEFKLDPEKVGFTERQIKDFISAYNQAAHGENKVISSVSPKPSFLILAVSGMTTNTTTDVFVQANYRIYFPRISKGTSFNTGLNYIRYNVDQPSQLAVNIHGYLYNTKPSVYKENVLSIPFQFQQNLLQRRIRPYFFFGASLNVHNYKDTENNPPPALRNILSSFSLVYGGGLECNVTRHIIIKGEYRYDLFSSPVMGGLGWIF